MLACQLTGSRPAGRISCLTMRNTKPGGNVMSSSAAVATDLDQLHALNRDYINSVQTMDVKRFDQILSDDFVCSNPDGSRVDRAAFLQQTARPIVIRNLEARDVDVRLMGDFAIIHARTTFALPDGRPGAGRYTDIWAKRNGGRWLCVAAHVTRC
jgi:ketosteroid isomerase-like protein